MKRWLAIVSALLLAQPMWAWALEFGNTQDEFAHRSWLKKDGLPANNILAIHQTRDGYLWIATDLGLARFDGLKFTVFDHSTNPELPLDAWPVLGEDHEGNLWMGGFGVLMSCQRGKFVRQYTSVLPDGSKRATGVSAFAPCRRGGIWIGSAEGLWLSQGGRVQLVRKAFTAGEPEIHGLLEDPSGILWEATERGLLQKFEPVSGKLEFVGDVGGGSGPVARAMCIAADGSLWVQFWEGWGGNGWLAHLKNGKWTKHSDLSIHLLHGTQNAEAFLQPDRAGNVWTPALWQGLDRIKGHSVTRYIVPGINNDDYVTCFDEDREGNLWLGTRSSGLHCLHPTPFKRITPPDCPAARIYTISQTHDGTVWVGTETGLDRLLAGHWFRCSQPSIVPEDSLRSVAEDSPGAVWIGTLRSLSSIRNGVLELEDFPPPGQSHISLREIYPARDGSLWIATKQGLYHSANGIWTIFTPSEGLASRDVRAVIEDGTGRLWIGTDGGGLQCFHAGRFTTFTTTNGLSDNRVRALHQDTEGSLWIGTEHGLNRMQAGQIHRFTGQDGLPDDTITEIVEDDYGQLWIGAQRGIFRVPKSDLTAVASGRIRELHCVSYSKADGLPGSETSGQVSHPAACKTRDGRIWFGTASGAVVFDPASRREEIEAPPPIVIEQARANGKIVYSYGPSDDQGVRHTEPSVLQGGELLLPRGGARVLEIRYTANTFVSPEQTRFRYRLLGLNDTWIEAGTHREADFIDLPPGRYQFEIMARDHHGIWSTPQAALALDLPPLYYQAAWFRGACGLAIVLLGWGAYRWRLREVKKVQELEAELAVANERARIAKDLHDGLGASLTHLSMLAEFAGEQGSRAVPIEGQLRKLSLAAKETALTLKEIVWAANPMDATLAGFVSHACQYAEEFLRPAKIHCRLKIPQDLPARRLSSSDRHHLFLVFKEALNNVAKHSQASKLLIRVQTEGALFHLILEDNGRGLSAAGSVAPSSGNGLINMRQRVESLGGLLEISSLGLGNGTSIRISLPLEIQPLRIESSKNKQVT